jgi:hypothetical protein
VEQLTGWLAESLGWDKKQTGVEIERALAILSEKHAVYLK